jgi:putative SOS response-associated peptidase YedK
MCTNYRPTARDHLRAQMGAEPPGGEYVAEAWPGYRAPIVRLAPGGGRECLLAGFGLIPPWAKDAKISRSTYNARSETVAEKPSFRNAWRRGQFCLVPMDAFFEPCYESGKAVRWRIARADGRPMAAAGIWERWVAPATGEALHTFSMLTVNADGHPVMGRMHGAGEEKRSIVPLEESSFEAWCTAGPREAAELLCPPPPGLLVAEASPLERGTRVTAGRGRTASAPQGRESADPAGGSGNRDR